MNATGIHDRRMTQKDTKRREEVSFEGGVERHETFDVLVETQEEKNDKTFLFCPSLHLDIVCP